MMNRLERDNQFITNRIHIGQPFFIGRIAGIELKIAYSLLHRRPLDMVHEIKELENNAGIHVKDLDSLRVYVDQLVAAYDHCTAIAEWEALGVVFAITGDGQRLIADRTPSIPALLCETVMDASLIR